MDAFYMQKCLDLARKGAGSVRSNPLVGAVIVYDNSVIGKGFHEKYGSHHAEVNAINSVKDKSLLSKSTLYVNLEPCSHFGKTPPCVELIIKNKIPRVVIGCIDPHEAVSGSGVRALIRAKIDVVVGILEHECLELNRYFIFYHKNKRPYVLIKWAQSADGYIDIKRNSSVEPIKFSSNYMVDFNQKKRAMFDAIMIGTNTALLDNPNLTSIYDKKKALIRVIIDRKRKIPLHYNIHNGEIRTIIITEEEPVDSGFAEYIKINFDNTSVKNIINILYNEKIKSVLIEGGAFLAQKIIDSNLWDELQIELSNVYLKDGVKSCNYMNICNIEDMRKSIFCDPINNNSIVSVWNNHTQTLSHD